MASKLNWRRRLLFHGITALFLLLFVEVVLQAFYFATVGDFLFRRTLPPIYAADPVRCYKLRPGLDYTHSTNEFSSRIFTNAQGLRTDERRLDVAHDKPDDVFRVLFLGPSFAFGWGNDWEDAYTTRIAAGLDGRGRRIETINLGTPGQGLGSQLCWIREEGHRFRPDLVVTTTYGATVPAIPDHCPDDLSCPIVDDHRLYSTRPTLRKRAMAFAKGLGIVFYGYYAYNAIAGGGDGDAGMGKELHSEEERAAAGADVATTVEHFERTVAFIREHLGPDTGVAFLHIPLSFVPHPEDISRWSHLTDMTPEKSRARTSRASEALNARGITVIDTTDRLAEAARDERMYYWLDIHLTPAGNRVVAEAALEPLQRLVPAAAVERPDPATTTEPARTSG